MRGKKRIPRLRVKARITSKVMEKDLLEKARLLMEEPELILPDCAEDCGSCPFKKTRAHIERIRKYKDDPVKLAKLARRGDKLARAYAATIGLVHEEKTPYLATATYPAGTITFALRGKTDREKLIGVQNFDSPKWRVLSVLDLVRKKGLHFYSYGDNFVCTGRSSRPPEEYVKLAAESVGATRLDGDTYSCPHNPASTDHLQFDWVSAGEKVLVCDQCATKNKNTLSKLAEGMAVPRVLDEFEISVVRPLKGNENGECQGLLDKAVDKDLIEDYSSGKLGDKELTGRHVNDVIDSLKGLDRKVYVRGDRCFGDDADAFISELTSDEVERKALRALLKEVNHPVVLEPSDSVNKLLGTYWSVHGKEVLEAVVSKELVEKYYSDDESERSPLKIIRQALREANREAVCSRIPRYAQLSQYGGFADEVVRAFKTGGAAEAISILDGEKSNDHRIRSMTHAFYLALGVSSKSWKFTNEEKEYGRHLEPYAKKVLTTTGSDDHHNAFLEFLREAGCGDELKRV